MKILVTDGDSRAALAVTRSLGRLGHEVIVAERRLPSLAQVSRYCRASVVCRDPVHCEEGFLEDIRRAVRDLRIDVLMPVKEITTILLTRHRGEFEPSCKLPFAAADDIARAADKVEVLKSAQQLGIPVPKTILLEAPDRLRELRPRLSFPLVIKPHRSRVRAPTRWLSASVSYAHNIDELSRDVRRRNAHEFPLLLQERIVGPGLGVFACYDRERLVGLFGHRRLREKPPSGGVSVLCESIPVESTVGAWAEALLRHFHWHGVAMVEFKLDERSLTPVLMEINGRFWGSLQLAIDAGVDFPGIVLSTLLDLPVEPRRTYRVGIRSRWFWGDVDSLLARLRRQTDPGLDEQTLLEKLKGILTFMVIWSPGVHYENPKLADVRPWLYETHQWLRATSNRHALA